MAPAASPTVQSAHLLPHGHSPRAGSRQRTSHSILRWIPALSPKSQVPSPKS